MKLYLYFFVVFIAQTMVYSETVKVFLTTERRVSISEYALSRPISGAGDLKLSYYCPGKQIGIIELSLTLEKIQSSAKAQKSLEEPFFGEGTYLLLVDGKGKTYIAIFEHESEKVTTKRIGIGSLAKLDEKGEVQIGYPYESTTWNKSFIEEIRKCLLKWKESDGIPDVKD